MSDFMNDIVEKGETRRQFLKLVGSGAVIVPLVGVSACSGGDSDDAMAPAASPAEPAATEAKPAAPGSSTLPILSEDDAAALALGYKHAAADVDTERFPARADPKNANAVCANCILYQGGAEQEWGLCTIFPGKQVNAAGWCASYAPTG